MYRIRPRISLTLIAIAAAIGFGVFQVQSANAQAAASYTWEYDNQNFYREYGLTYSMQGLTPGADYRWTFYLLNDQGLAIDIVATRSLTATGTTATIHINRDEWPADTYAPVLVRDNYGNNLSYHYLAPQFPNFPNNSEWEDSNGNTAENLKQSPGSRRSVTGPCKAPPYNDDLNNGWHHTGNACSVTVLPDGYMLLHYRIDAADYGDGHTIQFQRVEPETLDVEVFDIDEMVEYNRTGHNTVFNSGSQQRNNFVLLNTSGDIDTLPFIDPTAAANFTAGMNPLAATFSTGAYTCTREDSGGSWESDCESLMLVSDASNGNEWELTFQQGSVKPQNIQSAVFRQSTSEIWDAYNGTYEFGDSEVGLVDLAVYPFTTNRVRTYTVDVANSTIGNTATGDWTVFPAHLPTNSATPAEMYFTAVAPSNNEQPTYVIGAADEFSSGIQQLLQDTGFDTAAGQFLLLLILVPAGLVGIWYLKAPPVFGAYWYLFVGGFILLIAFSTKTANGLFSLLFLVSVPLVIMLAILAQRSDGGGDESLG